MLYIGILVCTTISGTIFTVAKISDKSDGKSKRKRKYSKCHSHCMFKKLNNYPIKEGIKMRTKLQYVDNIIIKF